MKRKQFMMLLCVMATSACFKMPVMAKEAVPDQTTQETTEYQEDTNVLIVEEEVVQDPEWKEGWYQDEEGNYYYNQNGESLKSTIAEIQDDDGVAHAYYFDENGYWFNESQGIRWAEVIVPDDEYGQFTYGYVQTDENGYLIKGWNQEHSSYYGEDYLAYESQLLEEDEKLYYFDEYANLCVDQIVIADGVTYQADENGVLTVLDMSGKSEWIQSGDYWYLYVDGKTIRDQFYVHYGTTYYFDAQGRMATGVFWVEEKNYFAEESGKVILNVKNGWHYSKDTKKWAYFRSGEPVYDEVININGTYYYLDWDGILQTGAFWGYHPDTYEYGCFFADHNGAIQFSSKWYSMDGKWYYVDKDGNAVRNGFYMIGNKKYYFDYEAQMQTGVIWLWDHETYESVLYITDSSGVVQDKPGWNQVNHEWYYMNPDGSLVIDSFIQNNTYYFDYNGKMKTGLFSIYMQDECINLLYYANSDGKILKNQWVKDGTVYYFAGKDGRFLTNQWISNKYYLNDSGAMVVGSYEVDGTVYKFADDGTKIAAVEKKGWQWVDGKWYYYDAKGNEVNGWVNSGKDWYYFINSEMITNDVIYSDTDDKLYYCRYDGKMVTNGWCKTNWWWSYADADGSLLHNTWKKIGNKWYYFEDCVMMQDTACTINGKVYLFDKDGAWIDKNLKKSSWIKTDSGQWYYINADGTLNTEEEKIIGGTKYYFYDDGTLMTNIVMYQDNEAVWIGPNGYVDKTDGWKKAYDSWVYVLNGKVQEGLMTISGKQYYLSPYIHVGGGYIYNEDTNQENYMFFDSNGVRQKLKEGWMSVKVNGKTYWYYIKDGKPVTGDYAGFNFGMEGYLVMGSRYQTNGKWYMYDENGYLYTKGWIKMDGIWYYAGTSGALYTGEHKIGGKTYWFNSAGEWIK